MTTEAPRRHPVHLVHRVGAALLGVFLCVFGALGFASASSLFGGDGDVVLGLGTNGALATVSVVVGLVLLVAAWWGDPISSTVAMAAGGLFLVSGLVHLAVLGTGWNIFAFGFSNIVFSLVVGLALGFLGAYGRLSGGLPPDNPYRRAHPLGSKRPAPEEQEAAESVSAEEQEMLEAEMAMGEGHPTPRQEELVAREMAEQRRREHRRAWRNVREREDDGGSQR
ncbi:DUF4383 domain-containing protein [Saccharopolyspora sp. HNM0983]|uniref:DUF4383 domain-containing protein n=1 Tax=Saccharopolyspora montiporae TaxID=2781240 RepID=A0A929B901_9PSEU|nr:DUF4383 domain-containing protein [Saccharopolyspora sp. HNM0983]MBE9373768.1 DUF4383 domain-containing protein [Saccharopolyspora sp. HNM0983]